jgi:Cu+-exporting ATPase
MSAVSSALSSLWHGDTLDSASGKVELPHIENEPLGSSLEKLDKCELRIEGMTCGACVEVSTSQTTPYMHPLDLL